MAGTLVKIIVGVGSLLIGAGMTYFYSLNCVRPSCPLPTDQGTLILIGVVMTVFAYIALYFMTKGSSS
jgi:uncharacterized membrane protein YidH (DUF202 family)